MTAPERHCDLALKGGLASGVVYPAAIGEIAAHFSLVGLTGTSAGAIAAALAAAAELRRRRTGSSQGFERLEEIGREIASPGRLVTLFAPDPGTREQFAALWTWAERKLDWRSKLALGWRLRSRRSRERFFGPISRNGFGLASGMGGGAPGDPPALTPWLTALLDEVAGLEAAERPLTFAHLRNAPRSDRQVALQGPGEPAIDLRAVTTCLTLGRPFEIPFRDRIFAFDPAEMKRLFPARVVASMIAAAEGIESDLLRRDGRVPLAGEDLPVIVAVRMSLSFPLLFSMVPLWAADHHREGSPLRRLWFSDGGVTSNFPVHRFDHLVPRWPTLAVNLRSTDPDGVAGRRRLRREGGLVFLPARRSDAVRELWRSVGEGESSFGALVSFVGALFRSAQNWHDESFLRLPGFRDRVVEIWLRPEEGGLNLDMDPETISSLVERGRTAGKRLAERFAADPPPGGRPRPLSWEGHRWTLLRSNLAGLAEELRALARHVDAETGEADGILELLAGMERPAAYRFRSEARRAEAEAIVRRLLDLGRRLTEDDPFTEGPRPPVEIGTRAPF